jgi:cell division transport system permease protein
MAKRFKNRRLFWTHVPRNLSTLWVLLLAWRRDLWGMYEPKNETDKGYTLVSLKSLMGKTLWSTLALLSFLAALATGVASLVIQNSWRWYDLLPQTLTLQVFSNDGSRFEDAFADVVKRIKKTQGVERVVSYSQEDSEQFLKPWLGSEDIFAELPIPRLIVVYPRSKGSVDSESLKKIVEATGLQAMINDNKEWRSDINALIAVVGGGAFLSAFLILATVALAVMLATRAAVIANADTLEVLYYIGARDDFIVGEFQSRFLKMGIQGAALGIFSAMGVLLMLSFFFSTVHDQRMDLPFVRSGLFLSGYGYLLLLFIGVILSGITGYVSRITAYRHLQK